MLNFRSSNAIAKVAEPKRVATCEAGAFEPKASSFPVPVASEASETPQTPQTQEIDTRLKMLSNNSLYLLHTCPRKYQLTKLMGTEREDSMHLSFGSAFGEGIQQLLCGADLQDAVISAVLQWDMNIFVEDIQDKTLWRCIAALEAFWHKLHDPVAALHAEMGLGVETEMGMDMDSLTPNILFDYEVATFNDRYATELGFAIELPDGFVYRGFVDLVLQHKQTKAPLVVDIKTTGATYTNSAKFQNSPQALGYSIVVDAVTGGTFDEFGVVYYEYMTRLKKYVTHYFVFSLLSRAKWLHNLVTDVNILKLYASNSEFPTHGENCAGFSRTCPLLNTCGISTESLLGEAWKPDTRPWQEIDARGGRVKPIHIHVTLQELVQGQLDRISRLHG